MAEGLHAYRLASPEEKRFAEAWAKESVLRWLLGNIRADTQIPAEPAERDRVVAATVIQWLGSPVGQAFLSELGYEKTRGAPK